MNDGFIFHFGFRYAKMCNREQNPAKAVLILSGKRKGWKKEMKKKAVKRLLAAVLCAVMVMPGVNVCAQESEVPTAAEELTEIFLSYDR